MSTYETVSAKTIVDYWLERGKIPLAAPSFSGAVNRNATLNEGDRLQSSGQFEEAKKKYLQYVAELMTEGKDRPVQYVAIRLQLNQVLFHVSQIHKVAYRPTPKCACTTVKKAFFEVLHGKSYSSEETKTGHVHQYFNRLVESIEVDPNEYLAFAVARDPIKRFVSGYRNRVVYHKEIAQLLTLDGQKYQPPELSDFALALPDFLNMALPISHHMSLQKAILGDNVAKYSRIYKIEELPDLQAELSKRKGTLVPFGRDQAGGPKVSVSDLTNDAFEFLLEFFKKDYDLLADHYSTEDTKAEYYAQLR
jgi:hypothetical protein